jgi:hypothetical protein
VAEIGNKEQESKPHPIYSVVRHCPHDLWKISNWQLAIGSFMSCAGGQFKFAAPVLSGMAMRFAPEESS